jgi:hypothetical protein
MVSNWQNGVLVIFAIEPFASEPGTLRLERG